MDNNAENRNSYGNILKAIGLFGGVKIFQILFNLLKTKVLAMLLGPIGVGVNGMLLSVTGFVNALTGLGLHTSSVRDISKAYSSNDEKSISRVYAVLRKLVLFTGLLGAVITFFAAPILSKVAFGNSDYIVTFRVVSIVLLIDQLAVGNNAFLQGTFRYKYMARASVIGSFLGFVVSVPAYYFFHNSGIVVVIVLSSIIAFVASAFYVNKLNIKGASLSNKDVFKEGTEMIKLGFAISLSGVVGTGATLLIRFFISNYGNVEHVGLYTAGISIVTQYVNVILVSMGSDYAPRLASVSDKNETFIEVINRQIKLILVLVCPLIILFVVFVKQLIILLYSVDFLQIIGQMEWMAIAMIWRCVSWGLSYSVIAKGKSKLFFYNELVTNIYTVLFSIAGYYFCGFVGIGVAFFISNLLYMIQMSIVTKMDFGFTLKKETLKVLVLFTGLLLLTFIDAVSFTDSIARYVIGVVIFLVVAYYSITQLNDMVDLKKIKDKLLKK